MITAIELLYPNILWSHEFEMRWLYFVAIVLVAPPVVATSLAFSPRTMALSEGPLLVLHEIIH